MSGENGMVKTRILAIAGLVAGLGAGLPVLLGVGTVSGCATTGDAVSTARPDFSAGQTYHYGLYPGFRQHLSLNRAVGPRAVR